MHSESLHLVSAWVVGNYTETVFHQDQYRGLSPAPTVTNENTISYRLQAVLYSLHIFISIYCLLSYGAGFQFPLLTIYFHKAPWSRGMGKAQRHLYNLNTSTRPGGANEMQTEDAAQGTNSPAD